METTTKEQEMTATDRMKQDRDERIEADLKARYEVLSPESKALVDRYTKKA